VHLVIDGAVIRATLQARLDGSSSAAYCCQAGHDTVEAAAAHGGQVEAADEVAMWYRLAAARVVAADPGNGKPVDPYLDGGPQPVLVFDKQDIQSNVSIDQASDGSITVLGHKYKVVSDNGAKCVAILDDGDSKTPVVGKA
jgi:hypothetical protein